MAALLDYQVYLSATDLYVSCIFKQARFDLARVTSRESRVLALHESVHRGENLMPRVRTWRLRVARTFY